MYDKLTKGESGVFISASFCPKYFVWVMWQIVYVASESLFRRWQWQVTEKVEIICHYWCPLQCPVQSPICAQSQLVIVKGFKTKSPALCRVHCGFYILARSMEWISFDFRGEINEFSSLCFRFHLVCSLVWFITVISRNKLQPGQWNVGAALTKIRNILHQTDQLRHLPLTQKLHKSNVPLYLSEVFVDSEKWSKCCLFVNIRNEVINKNSNSKKI